MVLLGKEFDEAWLEDVAQGAALEWVAHASIAHGDGWRIPDLVLTVAGREVMPIEVKVDAPLRGAEGDTQLHQYGMWLGKTMGESCLA